MKQLPINCPSCKTRMQVIELACKNCGTSVKGDYVLPLFLELSQEEQSFILNFFKFSGSIKKMAEEAGISYPTMRNYLDDLIEKTIKLEKGI